MQTFGKLQLSINFSQLGLNELLGGGGGLFEEDGSGLDRPEGRDFCFFSAGAGMIGIGLALLITDGNVPNEQK
jgi:hypothetical protein